MKPERILAFSNTCFVAIQLFFLYYLFGSNISLRTAQMYNSFQLELNGLTDLWANFVLYIHSDKGTFAAYFLIGFLILVALAIIFAFSRMYDNIKFQVFVLAVNQVCLIILIFCFVTIHSHVIQCFGDVGPGSWP